MLDLLLSSSLSSPLLAQSEAIAQPLIESRVGNATQTTIETFYNFPITPNISAGVFSQVILNPANRESNGAIGTGGLRTVFSF